MTWKSSTSSLKWIPWSVNLLPQQLDEQEAKFATLFVPHSVQSSQSVFRDKQIMQVSRLKALSRVVTIVTGL